MEQVIIFATKPIVLIIASLCRSISSKLVIQISAPLLLVILAFAIHRDFYDRNDSFCWIRPDYIILAVVVPLTILILNGLVCLLIILLRMYPNAKVFRPLSRLVSVQSNLISKAKKKIAGGEIITVLIMQFNLGLPWAVQYLTLFAPKATVWHYVFTLTLGTQGIVILIIFIYKRYKVYLGQQITTTTSGAETGITSTKSVVIREEQTKSSEYDPVADDSAVYDPAAYDYEIPRISATENVTHRSLQNATHRSPNGTNDLDNNSKTLTGQFQFTSIPPEGRRGLRRLN